MDSRVVSSADATPPGFRWLGLKRIHWEDPHGRARVWESAERSTRRGAVDGVAIVAKVVRRGRPPALPIVRQFRPTLGADCLELPAGLVDGGEDAGQAAARELREETGYSGRVLDVSPVCASDPGLTNANMQLVVMEVDGDAPENRGAQQQLEDGEFVEVVEAPWGPALHAWLKDQMRERGCQVDARLLAYAAGLEQAAATVATQRHAQQRRRSGAGSSIVRELGLAAAGAAAALLAASKFAR